MVERQVDDAPHLFFVAYGGGHAAMLVPVAQEATRRGYRVSFLALTTGKAVVEKSGVPAIGFADLWEYAAQGARGYGEEMWAHLPPGGTVSREESVAYLGISFADLVAEHGEAEARRLYLAHGRHAFLPCSFFERVLASMEPDLVVATNSPRAERAAVMASRRRGIPAVCAVDLFALQEMKWIGQPGYADRVCVLNEDVRRMFLRHGRLPHEVVVTGNPAFDRLGDPAVLAAGAQLRRQHGWDDGRVNILWASQIEPSRHPFTGREGDPALPRQVEHCLRAFVRAHGRYRLVVRYHPSEIEVFQPESNVVFSPTSEPLAPLLHAVDLVVVTASTVGLEAALAGRPVVSVDCSVFTADAPYASMGISTGVATLAELPAAVERVANARSRSANDSSQRRSAHSATQHVADVIDSLLFSTGA